MANSRLFVGTYLPIMIPDPKKYLVYQCGDEWCVMHITIDRKKYMVVGIFTCEDDAKLFKKAYKNLKKAYKKRAMKIMGLK